MRYTDHESVQYKRSDINQYSSRNLSIFLIFVIVRTEVCRPHFSYNLKTYDNKVRQKKKKKKHTRKLGKMSSNNMKNKLLPIIRLHKFYIQIYIHTYY